MPKLRFYFAFASINHFRDTRQRDMIRKKTLKNKGKIFLKKVEKKLLTISDIRPILRLLSDGAHTTAGRQNDKHN
jgi:hypothetical protein